jgi:hypothetical protein
MKRRNASWSCQGKVAVSVVWRGVAVSVVEYVIYYRFKKTLRREIIVFILMYITVIKLYILR